MRRAILLLAFTACASPGFAESADWRFAPPDATVFAGVEWTRIGKQMQPFLKQANICGKATLDFLSRLERIQIAFVMRGTEPQMVALMEGTFRPADLEQLSMAAGLSEGRVRTSKNQMSVSQIDARHVLFGDRGEVARSLQRWKQPVQGLPATLAAAEPALRSGDFWLIGNLPRDYTPLLAMASPASLAKMALDVEPVKVPEVPKFAVIHGMGIEPVRAPVY